MTRKAALSITLVSAFTLILYTTLAAVAAPTAVVHMTNSVHGSGWFQYLAEKADEFNKLHPEIEVQVVRTSAYSDKFATMTAGGAPPDVTDFTPAVAAPFVQTGVFQDMRIFMDADESFHREDMLPIGFQALTLPDGSVWAFPFDIYPLVTYYNEDILNEAGLALPNDQPLRDWDWDQVINIGKKTTRLQPDGRATQYGIDRPNQRWIAVLNQAGGSPYDRMIFPTASGWNTPEVREGMEWLRSIFVDHQIAAPYGGSHTNEYYFWLGTSAMHLAYGPGMIGGAYPDLGFGWDITRPPLGPANRGSMYTVNAFQIAADSQSQAEAWEWIKFIAYNEESLMRFVELTSRIPALASVQNVYASLANNPPRSWFLFYETATDPHIAPPVMDPKGGRVDQAVFAGFGQIFRGEQGTDVVLEEVHRQVNAILSE